MSSSAPVTDGSASQNAILIAVGVVVVAGVAGSVFAHENAAQILGFCTLICVSLLGLLQQVKTAARAAEVATKVEEVKTVAAEAATKVKEVKQSLATSTSETTATLADLQRVAKLTHGLVNSAMLAQKRLYAIATRSLANERPDDPVARANADKAEQEVRDHEQQQGSGEAGR